MARLQNAASVLDGELRTVRDVQMVLSDLSHKTDSKADGRLFEALAADLSGIKVKLGPLLSSESLKSLCFDMGCV